MALGGIYRPRLGAVSGPSSSADGLHRLRRFVALLGVILLLELIYIPFRSSRFAVTAIELRGDPRVAEEVAPRLRVPANTNIFLAPTASLKAQAESLPAVREAQVSRNWQRHLIVTLERREAMAVIRGTKQAILIDPSGVLFTIRNEWGWGVPELTSPRLRVGDIISATARAELKQLLDTLRALGPAPQLRIARLMMDRNGEIEAVLDAGTRVRLGSTASLDVKTKLLTAALEQLGAERISFLDLTDPLAAYWRERTPESLTGTPKSPARVLESPVQTPDLPASPPER